MEKSKPSNIGSVKIGNFFIKRLLKEYQSLNQNISQNLDHTFYTNEQGNVLSSEPEKIKVGQRTFDCLSFEDYKK